MKILRYLLDVAATYLIVQVTGLIAGFLALGLGPQHLLDGMVIGLMITIIPTVIYSFVYVAVIRLIAKPSSALLTHIWVAVILTLIVYVLHCVFFIKDTVSFTSLGTWQTLISCFIAASCAAVYLWMRSGRAPSRMEDM